MVLALLSLHLLQGDVVLGHVATWKLNSVGDETLHILRTPI